VLDALAEARDNAQFGEPDEFNALVEPDGTIAKAVMPDKLHVAAPGYTRWLEAMSPTLDLLLNEHP
jgi:lysophospholipase L1-like esterase